VRKRWLQITEIISTDRSANSSIYVVSNRHFREKCSFRRAPETHTSYVFNTEMRTGLRASVMFMSTVLPLLPCLAVPALKIGFDDIALVWLHTNWMNLSRT
jgi:hypothetical protein